MTEGAVAGVQPGSRRVRGGNSSSVRRNGNCKGDTIFGRVIEGIEIVQRIRRGRTERGLPKIRVTINAVTIRDTPPVRFVNDTAAELAGYKAIVETTKGAFELEFSPTARPRPSNFLRLAEAGVYDGVGVHRVAPGFVIRPARSPSARRSRRRRIAGPQPRAGIQQHANEFGLVSMARFEIPGATTSFFVCRHLRGPRQKCAAFARRSCADGTS
jgi:cyclophilin family peptidyl-prolyl cis-trans isomerase